jgi:hypothetical protein
MSKEVPSPSMGEGVGGGGGGKIPIPPILTFPPKGGRN